MKKQKHLTISLFTVIIAILACNAPTAAPAQANDTSTPEMAASPTETFTPMPTECTPTVTTNTEANVRNGPGLVYGVIGLLPQGAVANIAGKSYDGTWWYIDFPAGEGGHAWIAASVTTATCVSSTLAVIAAPPAPVAPTEVQPAANEPKAPTATKSGPLINLPPGIILLLPTPTPTSMFILYPLPIFTLNP